MGFEGGAPDLLIAGASARAAAFSAVRARLKVACADLFADRDLAAVADATPIADWPDGIEAWARRFPAAVPLVYVGGLENEPELLGRLGAARPLYGVCGDVLRKVRTPEVLRVLFTEHGLLFPVITSPAEANPAQRWLVKPRWSAAGRWVRFWRGTDDALREGEYLQEFVEGTPGSAAYLIRDGEAEFLGATVMLLPEEPPLGVAAPFTYVGSVTSDESDGGDLSRLGEALAAAGVVGLVGVDFIRSGERYAPIEVNPRYTAGMEVLELRSGRSLVAEHLAAFGGALPSRPTPVPQTSWGRHVGKWIVYAPGTLRVGEFPLPTSEAIALRHYQLADIPAAGTSVPEGGPVCTVFASGETIGECRRELSRCEREALGRCEAV